MLAGSWQLKDEEKYYTDNFKEFYKDDDMTQKLSDEDLVLWAVSLNSPWSQAHEKWTVECNCVNAYIPMDEKDPTFRCIYRVVGYEYITSTILGYGYTQQEALQDCIAHYDFLQKEYNVENESF